MYLLVFAWTEEFNPATGALCEQGWQWGGSLFIPPLATLEEGSWSTELTQLHLGRKCVHCSPAHHVCNDCLQHFVFCHFHWNKDTDTNLIQPQLLLLIKKSYRVACVHVFSVFTCSILAAHHTISVYPRQEVPFFMVFSGILCFSFMTLTVVAYHFPTVMTQYAKTVSDLVLYVMWCCVCVGHNDLPVIIGQVAGNSSITSCRHVTTMIL